LKAVSVRPEDGFVIGRRGIAVEDEEETVFLLLGGWRPTGVLAFVGLARFRVGRVSP
jgi:hypothetical protein